MKNRLLIHLLTQHLRSKQMWLKYCASREGARLGPALVPLGGGRDLEAKDVTAYDSSQ